MGVRCHRNRERAVQEVADPRQGGGPCDASWQTAMSRHDGLAVYALPTNPSSLERAVQHEHRVVFMLGEYGRGENYDLMRVASYPQPQSLGGIGSAG